jgi:hypothetical protein
MFAVEEKCCMNYANLRIRKKPAPRGAGFQAMKKLLAWTDVRFVILEAEPLVRRVGCWGAEVADEHQGLEVISEAIELIWKGSVVGPTFERVAHFQLAIVRTSHVFVPVNGPSTIRPVIATGSHA